MLLARSSLFAVRTRAVVRGADRADRAICRRAIRRSRARASATTCKLFATTFAAGFLFVSILIG